MKMLKKKSNIVVPINYETASILTRMKKRREYVLAQDYKCWFCGKPLSGTPPYDITNARIDWKLFPATFQDYPVHLHHDKKTKMTLGAVHMRCNAYLWQFKKE